MTARWAKSRFMGNSAWFAVVAVVAAVGLAAVGSAFAADADIAGSLAQVKQVGAKGAGHKEAVVALQTLNQASGSQLPTILAAMDGADALVANWLRGVAETVAQRELDKGGRLPLPALEQFLADTQHAPKARRLAYELIARVDAQAEQRIIPGLINDPSLELRRDAVELAFTAAQKAGDDKAAAVKAYRTAFTSARDIDQIQRAAAKLKELGEPVDLPQHMGFVMKWQVIGPFENAGGAGFDVVYPPEREFNAAAEYDGKKGKVKWVELATSDEYGQLDLNKQVGPHKGAVAYAYAEFESPREAAAEFRLGSVNANKIWVNGQLLTTNHVYHSGSAIDQYVAAGKLKPGRNTILLKIAQNEQTEPWAQDWKFQFRVCDAIGTPIR
ncbi:MAG: hypothetical protein U0939_15085 [Pirellulales bacterium]